MRMKMMNWTNYFLMKDGESFFTTGEDTNENQGRAERNYRYNGPVEALEEEMYFGEEIGLCNEEEMIQDEVRVMRFCTGEDIQPVEGVMHLNMKADSAVGNESQTAVSDMQAQGQLDLNYLTRGDLLAKKCC